MGFTEDLAVYISITMTGVSVAGWVVLLMASEGWVKKVSYIYSLDANLFEVDFKGGLASMLLHGVATKAAPGFVKSLQSIAFHKYSLQEFKERMCGLPEAGGPMVANLCPMWETILYSSWVLIFASVLGCFLLILGAGVLYYWAFVRAREKTRTVWKGLYLVAPFILAVGLGQYVACVQTVRSMPPEILGSGGGDIMGHNIPIAGGLIVLAVMPLVIIQSMVGRSIDEVRNENASAEKHFAREQGVEYGTLQGPGGMPGPPHQQHQQLPAEPYHNYGGGPPGWGLATGMMPPHPMQPHPMPPPHGMGGPAFQQPPPMAAGHVGFGGVQDQAYSNPGMTRMDLSMPAPADDARAAALDIDGAVASLSAGQDPYAATQQVQAGTYGAVSDSGMPPPPPAVSSAAPSGAAAGSAEP